MTNILLTNPFVLCEGLGKLLKKMEEIEENLSCKVSLLSFNARAYST